MDVPSTSSPNSPVLSPYREQVSRQLNRQFVAQVQEPAPDMLRQLQEAHQQQIVQMETFQRVQRQELETAAVKLSAQQAQIDQASLAQQHQDHFQRTQLSEGMNRQFDVMRAELDQRLSEGQGSQPDVRRKSRLIEEQPPALQQTVPLPQPPISVNSSRAQSQQSLGSWDMPEQSHIAPLPVQQAQTQDLTAQFNIHTPAVTDLPLAAGGDSDSSLELHSSQPTGR
jgi:hypothetical protein